VSQRSVETANMLARETPWKIHKTSTGEIEGYTCGRLGCYTDKLVACTSPHSALVLMVCLPCRWAEERWNELHRDGKSNCRGIIIPPGQEG